eukprot:TRINITY_DN22201_c0_g2_i1.p1 TRINITY_DN22201_c0_g2~~TRINITY_DN22201_c0_g2_i1.p1  ORF type:complete len:1036 (-),score=250.99 TRINITY_DN22201_c0_g2_i1:26-2947(-)
MDGLGVEIAKNVALAGIKSLTIHDTQPVTMLDLSTQFFLSESNIGQNRATVTASKLSELNPYTTIYCETHDLASADLTYFDKFTCVCIIGQPLEFQLKVNQYCHSKGIKFISSEARGCFGVVFNDFGNDFEVFDATGEELPEATIASITQDEKGLVTCVQGERHNFESDQFVIFSEVEGMTELNGTTHQITVDTPFSFRIGDTRGFSAHTRGGLAKQRRTVQKISFKTLGESLEEPEIAFVDGAKFANPAQLHIAYQALHKYRTVHKEYPAPWDPSVIQEFLQIAEEINSKTKAKVESLDKELLTKAAFTSRGQIVGITGYFGGVVAQEILKAISGKFTPLKQWQYIDCAEIVPSVTEIDEGNRPANNRNDSVRIVIGQKNVELLANGKLFMIGCGAIGCEMLKNFAMIGFGTKGLITVTDNDLIEKSNLNRQFLFRPNDISHPKSIRASAAVKVMNPDLNIEAHTHKVCKDSENIYTDEFFGKQDIIVNALDNVEARLYVDSRCVDNGKPLMESGTMGTKGHVQNILPHKTSNYAMTNDPPEAGFPFCTLKSFPSKIEHTIQWGRDKFQATFTLKPREISQFLVDSKSEGYWERLKAKNIAKPDLQRCIKLLTLRPKSFEECVAIAVNKFNSYFRNNILQLLYIYPEDYVKDNHLFWSPPRRIPKVVHFDPQNQTHLDFVAHCSSLFAKIYKLDSLIEADHEVIRKMAQAVPVTPYEIKKDKYIETDEKASQDQAREAKLLKETYNEGEMDAMIARLKELSETAPEMACEEFEKDVDENHHIDFITASSNIRAGQYGIELADRLKTKKIAGKIIPAMATTTAAVAGLVTIELIKVIIGIQNIEIFKNAWMNLALPLVMLSEPQACPVTKIKDDLTITLWTKRWEVKKGNLPLGQFIYHFKKEYGLNVSGVFYGVNMVYADIFPAHKQRLPYKMSRLLEVPEETQFVDLDCSFTKVGTNEEVTTVPKVRVYLK